MTTVHDVLATLKQTHQETLDIIHQLDLEDIVYTSSGWRVHDIITHLTWSDEQAASMIKAFLADTVYQLPSNLLVRSRGDIHRRNAWLRRQYYFKSSQDVIVDFSDVHFQLCESVLQVGTSRLHDEFSAPWGDRITTHTLAIWQIQHDQLHRRDLSRLLGFPNVLDNRVYHLVYSDL